MQHALDAHSIFARQVTIQHEIAAMYRHAWSGSQVAARWIHLGHLRNCPALFFKLGNESAGPTGIVAGDIPGNLLQIGHGTWREDQSARCRHPAGGRPNRARSQANTA